MITCKKSNLLIALVILVLLVLFPGCQSNNQTPTETSHVHSWQSATCTEPKICTTCGITSGSALGHTWQSATCTEAKFCERCGTTSGSASGHNWENATCTAPKFCTNCDSTIGDSLGHDWIAATYDSPMKCRRCGITQGSTKELKYVIDPVYTSTASSTYSGDNATHASYNLLDGDLKTNWTEGVTGNGEQEYVDFCFYDRYLISSVTIYAGNHASPTSYKYNSRPKDIALIFDDTVLSFTLKDQMVGQTIFFEEPIWSTGMSISIISVYPGSEWEDTVISEVSFAAYK